MSFYIAKRYVSHPVCGFLPHFAAVKQVLITAFKTPKTVFIADKYRLKNVKSSYSTAQFADDARNVLYYRGLRLHTKNVVISGWMKIVL